MDKYMIHNKYTSDATGTHYDVAVLRLDKPFVFDAFTNSRPIPLVEENNEPAQGTDVVVAGWGKFVSTIFTRKIKNNLICGRIPFIMHFKF